MGKWLGRTSMQIVDADAGADMEWTMRDAMGGHHLLYEASQPR